MLTDRECRENRAIDKLEDFLDTQAEKLPNFTEDDVVVLKRVISIVKGLEAFGSFAEFIKATIIWFGVIFTAFIAIKNGAINFILDVVSGK